MSGGVNQYEALLICLIASTVWLPLIFRRARIIKTQGSRSGHGVGVALEPRISLLLRLAGATILALPLVLASLA